MLRIDSFVIQQFFNGYGYNFGKQTEVYKL